jgi:hypothetical protein
MAYRLLMLSYHLVLISNYCLKLFRLSDLPIQLAMSNLRLTSQVDNNAALYLLVAKMGVHESDHCMHRISR